MFVHVAADAELGEHFRLEFVQGTLVHPGHFDKYNFGLTFPSGQWLYERTLAVNNVDVVCIFDVSKAAVIR